MFVLAFMCLCVFYVVFMCVPLCVLVFMCVHLWFAGVCLPGRRLLRWAEDALRHPLAPLQLLQITIYQPLTFIFIFLRFLLFPCFCRFLLFPCFCCFCFCYACKLCPCMFLSLSKRLCQCATCWQARWADTSTSSCCCTLSYSSSTW